ncbi:MAG: hypothetical protein Q9201_004929 [Fulgogasparrea decipioides]
MNHLPWPHNDHLSPPEVPYVCDDLPDFDNLEFKEYPFRRGWSTPEVKFNWIHPSQGVTAKRVQNWLYFGVLQVFLGNRFDKQEYITLSHVSNRWVLNTRLLPQRCSDVVRSINSDSFVSRPGSLGRNALRARWESAFFEAKLQFQYLDGQLNWEADHDLRIVVSPVPILLQSLERVAEEVFWLDDESSTIENIVLTPAKLSLWRMLDLGWCLAQAGHIFQFYTPFLNHYLSGLPRQHLNSHDNGCSWERCVGNNVDESSYKTQHVQDSCSCLFLGPEYQQLTELVRSDRIPLVEIEITDGQPALRMVAAELHTEYVSLSHVWAGGLGNFKENKLPVCQLLRLYQLLDGLDRFQASEFQLTIYDFQSQSWRWLKRVLGPLPPQRLIDYIIYLFRVVKDQTFLIYNHWLGPRKPRPMYFWMDTLCIPVKPEDLALRLKAINNMALTYAAARKCLVLDPELQDLSMNDLTHLQVNAHVLCSTWLTRSWTFQEARLSRAWFAQFADGLYNPDSRENGFLHHRLYSDWITYRSDADYLASEMIRWYNDMPAVRQRTMSANQGFRLLNDPLYNIIIVWNQLVSRSTSKPEDVHGILANMLDLSAGEVLALPSEQRMKAILGGQDKLPGGLLYNDATKIQDDNCRWVPLYPERTRLDEGYGALKPSRDGFFIDTTKANPVGFLVDASVPRSRKIRLGYSSDADPLWIIFNQEPNGPPTSWEAPGDTLATCYVVGDMKRSLLNPSLTRREVGARFALRKQEGPTLYLVYEYSFHYSHYPRRRDDDEAGSFMSIHAERTDADAVFHVDCGSHIQHQDISPAH